MKKSGLSVLTRQETSHAQRQRSQHRRGCGRDIIIGLAFTSSPQCTDHTSEQQSSSTTYYCLLPLFTIYITTYFKTGTDCYSLYLLSALSMSQRPLSYAAITNCIFALLQPIPYKNYAVSLIQSLQILPIYLSYILQFNLLLCTFNNVYFKYLL